MLEVIPDFGKNDNMITFVFLFCGYYSQFGARS